MENAEERNQKIIRAVLQKEASLCPGAVDLIGIYGSFLSGDIHPLSDLDLLIVSDDERASEVATDTANAFASVGARFTDIDSTSSLTSIPDELVEVGIIGTISTYGFKCEQLVLALPYSLCEAVWNWFTPQV